MVDQETTDQEITDQDVSDHQDVVDQDVIVPVRNVTKSVGREGVIPEKEKFLIALTNLSAISGLKIRNSVKTIIMSEKNKSNLLNMRTSVNKNIKTIADDNTFF